MSPRPAEIPETIFDVAMRLAREERPVEALQAVERGLVESTDREAHATAAATVLNEVARVSERMGDWGTAERALQIAIDLRPRYADLHFRRACVLIRHQRRAEARRSLDAALRLNPRYLAARVERALLDAREGLVGESLAALRLLSSEHPIDDSNTFQQGIQSLERADWDGAESLLRRSLGLDDAHLEEELRRFHTLVEQGEDARAADVLRQLVPRHEAYPDLHFLLGKVELHLGHWDDAVLALGRALELNPDFHAARVVLAQALDHLGQAAQAQEQIAIVLQHDPDHAEALERRRSWSERASHARRRGAASR